jgi:hypothetical protein
MCGTSVGAVLVSVTAGRRHVSIIRLSARVDNPPSTSPRLAHGHVPVEVHGVRNVAGR